MEKQKSKNKKILIFSLIILILLSIVSIFIGQYNISLLDTLKVIYDKNINITAYNVILNIRIPRTIAAIIIGASLSVAGITYQCVFRNSIASQDVLGASSGACVGAAIGIINDFNPLIIQGISFGFGCITIILVFIIANLLKDNKNVSLILSGVLIGGVMSSILGLLKYVVDPTRHLQTIVFWIMGDISSISMIQILYVLPFIIIGLSIIYLLRWKLNYFAIENQEALSIGFNIHKYQVIFICLSTILISACVSIAGSIGWIGLAIPHFVRLLVGNNNKNTILQSCICGSCFLLIVDILNRVVSTAEIPVSIISGIIGLPIFIICVYIKSIRK